MTNTQYLESVAARVGQAIADFQLLHHIKPNAVIMGSRVAEETAIAAGKLGESRCAAWIAYNAELKQKTFLGYPILIVARGREIGAAVIYPTSLWAKPQG